MERLGSDGFEKRRIAMTLEEYNALPLLPCGKEPLLSVYDNMITRCYCPSKGVGYMRYGGRGIAVCEEWRRSFESFKTWALPLWQPGLQLDRIDNDGNYTPSNCRFVSRRDQARNRRNNRMITLGRKTLCLCDWLKIFGLSWKCFYSRLESGMSEAEALTLPPRTSKGDKWVD